MCLRAYVRAYVCACVCVLCVRVLCVMCVRARVFSESACACVRGGVCVVFV